MLKKKITLVIAVLIVLGIAVTSILEFKKYSQKENINYANNTISQIKSDISSNNIAGAQTALDNLKSRISAKDYPTINKEIQTITTQIIQKENSINVDKSLTNIGNLIKKGSLTQASFEIQKLDSQDLSSTQKQTLSNYKNSLKQAKNEQQSSIIEKNSMNTLNQMMGDGQYEKAANFIATLDSTNFSEQNIAIITNYSKKIQDYENKFNIDDYKIPTSQIKGLYQEAFPASKDAVNVISNIPVYFIGNTPVYEIFANSKNIYIQADGTQGTSAIFTTALTNKNLYIITNGKKTLATAIPSDIS